MTAEFFPFTPDLLNTNRPPDADELGQARRMIVDFEDKLGILRQKISDTEAYLQRLKDEETILVEKAIPLSRIVSPLRRIPEDIFREIFMACIDANCNPTMSNKHAPVLLTHITSGMRRLALATPTLWAAIHIPIIHRVESHMIGLAKTIMEARTRGVEEWLLRRSGDVPLRISVKEVAVVYVNNKVEHLAEGIFGIIFSCHSRWRDIDLSLSWSSTVSSFLSFPPGDTRQLHGMHVRDSIIENDQYDYPILGSPNLHRIGGITIDFLVKKLSPECWFRLTHLHCGSLTSPSISHLVAALDQCRSLVNLCFEVVVLEPILAPVKDINLPLLEHLDVYEEVDDPALLQGSEVVVAGAINSPLLKTLTYAIHIDADIQPIQQLLKRSPNITILYLGPHMSADSYMSYLCHLPRLSVLDIRGIDNPDPTEFDRFLGQLVDENSGTEICPQLEYFRCRSPSIMTNVELLRTFIMRKIECTPHRKRWRVLAGRILYGKAQEHAIKSLINDMEKAEVTFDLDFYRQDPYGDGMGIADTNSRSPAFWPTACKKVEWISTHDGSVY